MAFGKIFFSIKTYQAIIAGLFVLLISSCGVVPKNYPVKKPFVYEYKINIEGNFTNTERSDLVSKLESQLDDSIHIRTIPQLYRQLLKKPPVYQSANADRSLLGMQVLLNSLGYFHDSIGYSTSIDTAKEDQYRVTVNFDVKPGIPITLDSISYTIANPELQRLADSTKNKSFLKKGDLFAKIPIGNEFSRLIDLYRSNGYMRFSIDELRGVWDTLDLSLLNPTTDPFEQPEILENIKERKDSTKVKLDIQLRPGYDKNKLIKYYNGNVTVYPDFNYASDVNDLEQYDTTINGIRIVYYSKIFKPKLIPQNIYLYHGRTYNQDAYFKTVNRFNSLGAWRLVNIDQNPRIGSDTVDYVIKLTPAKKYSYSADIEASINQSIISGNLFGIALNLGLENRNFARAADQTNTNARYGIELGNSGGSNFIQTKQVSLSHNIYFPRAIPNLKKIPDKFRDNFRSVFSMNVANTDRRYLYNLSTFNVSWGYDFQWKKKLFSVRMPNIEYSFLNERDSLRTLITNNPILKNIFTDGLISSMIFSYTMSGGKNNNLNILRANVEGSGFLSSLIHSNFLDTHLYRFLKTDIEMTRKIQYHKSSIALRFFAGVGYEFGSTKNPSKRNNLPFFKEYFAGGPYSMRAWALRRLGPGSTIKDFTGMGGTPERYGDVQLESNIEYRFPLANIAGQKVNGALFTDIGNVWYLKKSAAPPEEVFDFSRLAQDIAVGVGGGLRVDFGFIVIRVDYAYKAKDPSPDTAHAASQNKWFYNWKPFNGQLQLGIGYPFIF